MSTGTANRPPGEGADRTFLRPLRSSSLFINEMLDERSLNHVP